MRQKAEQFRHAVLAEQKPGHEAQNAEHIGLEPIERKDASWERLAPERKQPAARGGSLSMYLKFGSRAHHKILIAVPE